MTKITPDGGGQRSSFCRDALESLKKRAEGHAKQHPTLRHMLVLPEGETLLVPPRSGSHPPGHSSCHVPPAVSFGNSQVATVLPPASCWPSDLKPIRAVVAEQEFGPYRPLAQKPYRVHLFFGDVAGMAQLQSLAADLMNLADEVERAILDGHATVFFRSSSRIHGTDAEILDAWLCTVQWWAWKAVDSPIHTRPHVVSGGSAIAADRMDQAVFEKLSFSTLDCDVFTATAATIDLFFRFFTVPPDLAWAADYPPAPKPQEPVPDVESAKTKAPAQPGRDSRTSPVEQSSVKEPPKEAIITDKRNVPQSEPITNLPAAAEWERLRRDFDRRASEYPPLTLSILMFEPDSVPPFKEKFDQPNHAITLWQYIGNLRPGESPKSDKPELTAVALLEGQDTDLFRRMAYRAGSLLPAAMKDQFAVEIMKKVEKHDRPGKPVFAWNDDPLAVWLNLVLMVAASLQPERLRRNTLAVDPFAASLAVVDLIVSKLEPKVGAQGQAGEVPTIPPAEPQLVESAPSAPTRTPVITQNPPPTAGKDGHKPRKIWSRQHCPSCGEHQVEFISVSEFFKRSGKPAYNTVRKRVNEGKYWSDIGGNVPWCPACKERTPEGPGVLAPTDAPTALAPGVEPYKPSKQDQEQMLAWARGVVKATSGCDLPPENRTPLDSDPPSMRLGLERLHDAAEAIMGLARKLNRLPTRDEADDVAKKAISKARSQDVRISHQTDAYDKRQKSEEGQRFDDDNSQES